MTTISSKIISDSKALTTVTRKWKDAGEKIVFTNGCFDIIHMGHVLYLEEARALGDRLIVGLNSDSSVTRLKGPRRPITDQTNRAHVLAALASVDAVVVFDEDDPYRLISQILPDVLVKGGDWRPEQIVGSDVVLARGGEVHSLRFVEGYSTTGIEAKIRQL